MAASDVRFTRETIAAAIKMGRHRFQREELPRRIFSTQKRAALGGSVVYYIRRSNLIKIGTTTRLRSRMNSLMPDEILALEPGDEHTEAGRHLQFTELRADPRGEYFFPGAALLAHVSRTRREHGAPPEGLPTLRGASRAWAEDLEPADLC